MRSLKIIVTGGAGFIGSHIVDSYILAGHKVVVVDDLSFGKRKNIHPGAKFHKVNICDEKLIKRILEKEKPDIINHCAAKFGLGSNIYQNNILGTVNLLKHTKISRFIFSSSAAVYGEAKSLPITENADLLPISLYGLSKYLGEVAVEYYSKLQGFSYAILRYANIYGPRQRGGVVKRFYDFMISGRNPTIFGDGTKVRDYLSIDDVVSANKLILETNKNITLNIGSGVATRDSEIFEMVSCGLGFKGKYRCAPIRFGEIKKSVLDISLAKKTLGWQPALLPNIGILKLIRSYV